MTTNVFRNTRNTMIPGLALMAGLACNPMCPAQQQIPVPPAQQAPQSSLGTSFGGTFGPQTIFSPDLEAGDIFGAAVAVDGDVMLLGAEYDDDNGTDSGSVWVYRYLKGSWKPEQKLKPSDAQKGDNFGRAVTVRGNVAVIGAHWDDDKGSNAGSVYIFGFDGTEWVQQQKLVAPDGAPDDRFGATLALYGNRLLVGAWLDDDKGFNSGSVYSYHFNGSMWVLDQKLTASDGHAGAFFARYIGLTRNVAVIGAWHDNEKGVNAGAAYIFRYNGNEWVETQKLLPADLGPGDEFGWAAAMYGDVAIVGAYGDDEAATDAGATYVFRDLNGTFVLEQKLLADDAAAFNQMGYCIAVQGDQMLLGAKVTTSSVNQVGKAYVFRRENGTWKQKRLLEPPDGEDGDAFGFHLDMDGNTFVVGAWRHEAGVGIEAGAVYVWTEPGLKTDRIQKK
jgi:hypothetical protein